MAKCYQYDKDGYFVFETDDFGGFLPSGAVYDEPDFIDGHIPKWDGKKWNQAETHKGKEGYIDGQAHTIKGHGPLPKGWTTDKPEPTEKDSALSRIAEIDGEIIALEQKALRPLLAIRAEIDEPYDSERLDELTTQIIDLRCERQMLELIAYPESLF